MPVLKILNIEMKKLEKKVSSNLMLDALDAKIDNNTDMLETILAKVSNLEENLGRSWT